MFLSQLLQYKRLILISGLLAIMSLTATISLLSSSSADTIEVKTIQGTARLQADNEFVEIESAFVVWTPRFDLQIDQDSVILVKLIQGKLEVLTGDAVFSYPEVKKSKSTRAYHFANQEDKTVTFSFVKSATGKQFERAHESSLESVLGVMEVRNPEGEAQSEIRSIEAGKSQAKSLQNK